jgi:hypothetical protein
MVGVAVKAKGVIRHDDLRTLGAQNLDEWRTGHLWVLVPKGVRVVVVRPAHHSRIAKTQTIVTCDLQNLDRTIKLAAPHLGNQVTVMVVVLGLEPIGVIAALTIGARDQNRAHTLIGQ